MRAQLQPSGIDLGPPTELAPRIPFWATIISVFMGSLVGIRTGAIFWFPLRIATLAYLPFLFLRQRHTQPPLIRDAARFFLFMVVYGILSLGWSPDFGLGVRSAAILFTGVILAIMVFQRVREPGVMPGIMFVWTLATIVTSSLGLYEAYSGSHLFILASNPYATDRVVNRIGWLSPTVLSSNWNNFAFSNALSFFVLLGYSIEARGRPRLLAGLAASMAGVLVILSYSRAATLGTLAGLGVFGLCILVSRNARFRARALVAVSAVVVGVVVVRSEAVTKSAVYTAMVDKIFTADNTERMLYAQQGLRAVTDTYGLGRGLGASTVLIQGGSYHSYFVEILAELGVLVFLGFCALLLRTAILLFTAIRRRGRWIYFNSALLASCVAFPILQAGPSSITGEGIYWLWLGVLISHASLVSVPP